MNIKDILFYLMIGIVVVLSIYVFFFVKSNSYKCVNDPFVYGINLMSSSNGNDIYCTCSFQGSTQQLLITKYNKTVIDIKNPTFGKLPDLQFEMP